MQPDLPRIQLRRKKMVDFSLSIPLIVSSALAAPVGSWFNVSIATGPFLLIMASVLALAGVRMLLSPPVQEKGSSLAPLKKIVGGIGIGVCIGLLAVFWESAAAFLWFHC
ncbi:MAG: TSUP family transporter [Desulfosalsimonadaceae bacterium]